MRNFLVILTGLFFMGTLQVEARVTRNGYESVRALGMGGAFMSVADDQYLLFYNPAALTELREVHGHLFDFGLGVDTLATFGNLFTAATGEGYDSLFTPEGKQYMRASAQTSILTRYFGFTVYNHLHVFHEIENLNFPEIDLYFKNELGALMGVGIPVGPHMSLGFSARVVQRSTVDSTQTPGEILSKVGLTSTDFLNSAYETLQDELKLGWGFGVNSYFLAKVPLGRGYPEWRIAASIEDILDTKYRTLAGRPAPEKQDMSYHLGTSLKYTLSKHSHLTFALDMRNLFQRKSLNRMLRMGAELYLPGVSLRLGAYQGYLSAGLGWHLLPHTRVQLATYAVELGDSLWERSQRRWEAQVIIGFNPL